MKMNRRTERPRRRFSRMAGAYLLVMAMSTTAFATQKGAKPAESTVEGAKPVESTMAYELFALERGVRQVPPDAERLLRSAISDATTAALRTGRRPRTREEALAALDAIQVALVKHNFLQPPEEKDWPQTLGVALKPLTFLPESLRRVLSYHHNTRRARHLDLTKPLYYVDCDMGSQLFIAVGERLGWDIRLVEVPQHNFVRWHLSESIKVNWDWTRWESIEDGAYVTVPASGDPRLRALYLRSFEPTEARAYYAGLIGSQASLAKDKERLLQGALEVLPNHPLTLNNLAWVYATNPEFAKDKSDLAVAYGLAAWSMEPDDGNVADTVACAFAANGKRSLAEKIEEFAIARANSYGQRDSFRENLRRITAGELCK